MKLMKTGDEEKEVSLEGSQGIPNWSVMWSMWVKSYVCDAGLSPMCSRVKSLIRCEQSSVNSLHDPSARELSLNHQWLLSLIFLLLAVMVCNLASCSLL